MRDAAAGTPRSGTRWASSTPPTRANWRSGSCWPTRPARWARCTGRRRSTRPRWATRSWPAEADFLLGVAAKATGRGDTTYVGGCLFRVVGLCAHALHGSARRWLVNEKGAVAAAGRLPRAPAGFAERAHAVLAALGRSPAELATALAAARDLVAAVTAACR